MSRNEKKVDVIYVVGGFGQHKYLREEIERSFPGTTVLAPREANMSVMKGAIHFAYNRVSKTSYQPLFTLLVGSAENLRTSNLSLTSSTHRHYPPTSNKYILKRLVRKDENINASEILMEEVVPYEKDPGTDGRFCIELFASKSKTSMDEKDCTQFIGFTVESNSVHCVSISFTNNDIRIYINEKEKGHAQRMRIENSTIRKKLPSNWLSLSSCTVM